MTRNVAKILIALRRFRRRTFRRDPARLWLFAVIIGAAAAYGVIGFRLAIDFVSIIAFGATEEKLASGAGALPFMRAWAAPVVGGIVVSVILYFADRYNWLPVARGQGVAEVIEARAVRDGRVSFREGLSAATVFRCLSWIRRQRWARGTSGAYRRHDRFCP